jgi:mannose-6-phosphate isomerase-like protein (cupin superfamily)
MKYWIPLLLFLSLSPLQAADPQGFALWSGASLANLDKKLAPEINAQKVATEQLANFGNHSVMAAYREGDGEAELHERQADIFIVKKGQAILVVGGSIVTPKNTGPGEIRGASITGGENKRLAAGDVVHIPAGVPHQVLLDGSRQFLYLIVKVDAR